MMRQDERYMRLALKLACKRKARSSREPLVGALIVRDDKVVSGGYAGARPGLSAIASALEQAGPLAARATIYTNAEPCCDAVDFETCFQRLMASYPARVVVGSRIFDPPEADRSVSGFDSNGGRLTDALERLKALGVSVETGVCEKQCRNLNEIYLKYSRTGLPFVTVKFAESLDGRIATATGDSQWISGPASLRFAHSLRCEHDAIMVGIGTVLADDPQLTVRLVEGRDPMRVVVDSHLRIPLTARVLAEGAAHRTIIAAAEKADRDRARELERLGAQILRLPANPNSPGIDITKLLAALGRRSLGSVLVEGGAGIITSLLAARGVDRLVVAVAPKIIGRGREAVGDLGIVRLRDAITFSSIKTRKLGSDVIFDARLAAAT